MANIYGSDDDRLSRTTTVYSMAGGVSRTGTQYGAYDKYSGNEKYSQNDNNSSYRFYVPSTGIRISGGTKPSRVIFLL
jgi:hypothetical protein